MGSRPVTLKQRRPVATANIAELRVVNGRAVFTRKLHVVTNSSGRTHVTGCKNGKRINYWFGTRKRTRKSQRS